MSITLHFIAAVGMQVIAFTAVGMAGAAAMFRWQDGVRLSGFLVAAASAFAACFAARYLFFHVVPATCPACNGRCFPRTSGAGRISYCCRDCDQCTVTRFREGGR
jgi:hypothetical protein